MNVLATKYLMFVNYFTYSYFPETSRPSSLFILRAKVPKPLILQVTPEARSMRRIILQVTFAFAPLLFCLKVPRSSKYEKVHTSGQKQKEV